MTEARPYYETQADRHNEEKLALRLAEHWGLKVEKTPVAYTLDYGFLRNDQLLFMAEIKCRTVPKDRYPTYMLSAKKVAEATMLSSVLRVPCELIVSWSCGAIGWLNLSTEPTHVRWGGRTDRGDSNDVEPCLFWDIELFHDAIAPVRAKADEQV